uniref:Profilin n=1 Tax=Romanomermis culicivorax TaxID=13658 RepID=A0A915J3J7_ROMCU
MPSVTLDPGPKICHAIADAIGDPGPWAKNLPSADGKFLAIGPSLYAILVDGKQNVTLVSKNCLESAFFKTNNGKQ